MKLRKKTAIVISVVSFALLLLLHIIALIVVKDGFYNVEIGLAQRNVDRVVTSINEMKSNLIIKSSDWAKWNDLYDYIVDPNDDFINSNLNKNTITDLNLNFIIFTNTDDSIVYQNQYISIIDSHMTIDTNLIHLLIKAYKLTDHESIDNVSSGIVQFNDNPFLIVSRPILSSTGEGPPHGTLMFGKFIGPEQIEHVSAITNVHLDIFTVTSKNFPADIKDAMLDISFETPIKIKPVDSKTIAGYTLINDINNVPQLLFRVSTPREINRQANITLVYLLISFVVIGIIYGFSFLFIMEKTVIARTTALNSDVAHIGDSGNNHLRVQCSGRDELSMLSNSINIMLGKLEKNEADLRMHNVEMQLIMNTIPIGLISLDENFNITPVHSRSSKSILGISSPFGVSIFDALQLNKQSKEYNDFCDFLSLLQIGALPDEEMQGLNPFEILQIKIANSIKWIHVDFHIMQRDVSVRNHILVELKDFTNEKLLSEAIDRTEVQNMQLRVIAEDPDLFKEFLHESLQILEQTELNISMFNKNSDKSIIHEIFRNIHLLKGSSDSFGLINVAKIASDLEDDLGEIRNLDMSSIDDSIGIQSKLLKLSEEIYQTIIEARQIFGEYLLDQPEVMLRLSIDRLDSEINHIREIFCSQNRTSLTNGEANIAINMLHSNLRLETVRRGFTKTFRALPLLIKRLEKNCTVKIKGEDLLIDCMLARTLNAPLLHTIRNALDHGIETPEERLLLGKNESGTLNCSFSQNNGKIIIEISDDGRGIDTKKLREVAIQKGFLSKEANRSISDESVMELLFTPGFTTTEKITHVSGRGVGLDAVKAVIKDELGGTIKITTKIQSGTTFTFMIPDPSEQYKQ